MFWRTKVPAEAKILADESFTWTISRPGGSFQLQKYIIEVYPPNEQPFRTETRVWVNWPAMPEVGATVKALYVPGTKKAKIVLKGDPRFDWKLRRAAKKQAAAAERTRLLDAPSGKSPRR